MGEVVYLREIDAGTDNACWVVCAMGDPGAAAFTELVGVQVPSEPTEAMCWAGWRAEGAHFGQDNHPLEAPAKVWRAMLAAAPELKSTPCETCGGWGEIGSWSGGVASIDGGGGYESEPCPDCTAPVERKHGTTDARQAPGMTQNGAGGEAVKP